MTAAARFLDEIEARTLDVPEDLIDELRQWCLAPPVFLTRLHDRLLDGADIIDARGGNDAPQHLWDRWEAILVAYVCCRIAIEEDRRKGARRRRNRSLATMERS